MLSALNLPSLQRLGDYCNWNWKNTSGKIFVIFIVQLMLRTRIFWFFTLSCGIKIITYKIGIEKEHYLLQNVSCLKLRTEVE